LPAIRWDNGNRTVAPTATDVMALLGRTTGTWVHQEINDAIFCTAR
jgi:endoglucanase